MAKQTTNITDRIRAFTDGKVSEAELIKYLTKDIRYANTVECPYKTNTPEWYRWHDEGRPYTPGSFEEVTLAYDTGLLNTATYEKIYSELVRGAK